MKKTALFFLPFLLFLFLLPFSSEVKAQSQIKGWVTGENGQPLAYANVLLMNAADNILIKGEVNFATSIPIPILERLKTRILSIRSSASFG